MGQDAPRAAAVAAAPGMTGWSRRDAVRLGGTLGGTLGATLAVAGGGSPLHGVTRPIPRGGRGRQAALASRLDPIIVIDGTDVRALALRALDAAKAAGASYADVRFMRLLDQGISCGDSGLPGRNAGTFQENEEFGVGVRVRVGGGWGFAGSPYWDPEEVVALATAAAVQAKANARGTLSAPEWTPIPVAQGHWATPIKVDPFLVTLEERIDQMQAWAGLARRLPNGGASWDLTLFRRTEWAVATSEGSYFTQTLYKSGATFVVSRGMRIDGAVKGGSARARGLEFCAAGWELFTEADLPGQIPQLYEEADPRRVVEPPTKPGEVGRYDVVLDAWSAARLTQMTLGRATQLDVALGYEANAGGTSYLGPDPLALLGRYQAASPLVTLTANRSMPRGVATVKWDLEGVEPADFPVIQHGVLVNYPTTRALAPVLAPWDAAQGRPVRSHGCAWAQNGWNCPMLHTPNLVLEPGGEDLSFDDLVASTKRGLAVLRSEITTDFQVRTGAGFSYGWTEMREIMNGKLGARVTGLEFLFETTAFWKNVVALGGPRSAQHYVAADLKGRPPLQEVKYSLGAVPLKVRDVTFIDPARKA